jgi:hypothetical protein
MMPEFPAARSPRNPPTMERLLIRAACAWSYACSAVRLACLSDIASATGQPQAGQASRATESGRPDIEHVSH